ncbi:unnamed protein product [Mesocestoides corti]|uniref:Uncharacterized protein n=1 Tax=Mesocestoides corti TaxID=53468 RepID=A0A0R3U486_MESCO|nr:unnamed protein product [Mesocestoides corti]
MRTRSDQLKATLQLLAGDGGRTKANCCATDQRQSSHRLSSSASPLMGNDAAMESARRSAIIYRRGGTLPHWEHGHQGQMYPV